MNLLEQYIEEVHSEEPLKYPDREFVKVDVTTNCYGIKKRDTYIFNTFEWEKYKSQGYWMA